MRLPTWLLLVLFCSYLSVANARAEPPAPTAASPEERLAREHFERGETAYNRGDYARAIEEWEAAYAAEPRPRIQYNIYQARERLGDLPAAAEALQRYLDGADRGDPSYANAQARMANLQQRLQSTGVRLVGGPLGATVQVDEQTYGRLPLDPILVPPGQHRIAVAREGFQDFFTSVFVPAGQTIDVPVTMEQIPQPAADPILAPRPSEPSLGADVAASTASESSAAARPFLIASAGLAGAALLTGIWALNRDAELNDCDDPEFFCAHKDKVTGQRTAAVVATTVLGVGAVGSFVYGIVLRVRGDEERAALACSAGLGGAACRLRF